MSLARLEQDVLLAHVLGVSRAELYAYPERPLNENQKKLLCELMERRAAGEPMAYLTGHREFWSLD